MTNTVKTDAHLPGLVCWYRRHQRLLEWAYWPFVHSILANLSATSVIMEYKRRGTPIDPWEPYLWEFSSVATTMLGIWLIVQFDRRFPLNSKHILRNVVAHAAFSVVFSVLHVVGMVAIREWVYQQMGRDYDFGDWSLEAWYEYRKDAMTYLTIVGTLYIYRFVSSRIIGEASLIADGAATIENKFAERFLVRKFGRDFLLKTADVERIGADGNYMNMYAAGRIYPIRETMAGLEKRLDSDVFVRVHRSHIVNLDFVESVTPADSGDAVIRMRDGAELRLSRRFRDKFRTKIK